MCPVSDERKDEKMDSTKAVMRAGEVLWFVAAIGTVAGSIWLAMVIHWIAGIAVGAVWAGMFWLVDKAVGDGEWDDEEV